MLFYIIYLTLEGKSTLGSTINGLIPHYYNGKMQGKVYVNGKDLSKIKLHETICKTEEEIAKRVEDVYKDLDIVELKGKSVFELSNGQKQKIAIARAYAVKPLDNRFWNFNFFTCLYRCVSCNKTSQKAFQKSRSDLKSKTEYRKGG